MREPDFENVKKMDQPEVNTLIDQKHEHINRPPVVFSFLFGLFFIAAAFWFEHWFDWKGVSLEVLVNVGTTLLLASLLFFLQRRFVSQITKATERAASAVVDSRIAERLGPVGVRLEELSSRMDDLITQRDQSQDQILQELSRPTYKSVATAIALAQRINAIFQGKVTVQAGDDPFGYRAQFSWLHDRGDGRFGIASRSVLTVAILPPFNTQGYATTDWETIDTAESVGVRLISDLGSGDFTNKNWIKALANLQKALEVVVHSRRGDDNIPRIQGQLRELVGEEWAITSAGVESLDHDFKCNRIDLLAIGEPSHPPKPDWVEDPLWHELLRRTLEYFPYSAGPYRQEPRFIPLTRGPEDMFYDSRKR